MNDASRGTIYQKRPTPSGDLTRLPKWAQQYITSLTQFLDGIERTKRRLEKEHVEGEAAAFVYLEGYMVEPVIAGSWVRVEFPQSSKFYSRSHIDVSLRNGVVEISGTSGLAFQCDASNVIQVRLRDD